MIRNPFLPTFFATLGWFLAGSAAAQDQVPQWTLTDGRVLEGRIEQWRLTGGRPVLVLRRGDERQELPAAEVLAMHGPGPRLPGLPQIHLVGGEVLRGEVVGGDRAGESLELLSPVLGPMVVAVDRIDRILWRPDRARLRDLELPEGSDEALFFPATIGLDKASGSLHRFTDRGVLFEVEGEDGPRLFRYEEVVGLGIRDGFPPAAELPAELITRVGDRVHCALTGFENGRLQLELEGERRLELPLADVAAITWPGQGRRFLSELEPVRVEEQGFSGEVLHPFRRDQAVTGGFLVAGGRTHGRGLGVHSRSVLVFRVPEGVGLFHAQVALDDQVKSLRPRPHVEVRVRLDRKELAAFSLQGGDPPQNLGLLRVEPGALLTLEVDFGRGQDLADRVDWLSAVFLPDPRKD